MYITNIHSLFPIISEIEKVITAGGRKVLIAEIAVEYAFEMQTLASCNYFVIPNNAEQIYNGFRNEDQSNSHSNFANKHWQASDFFSTWPDNIILINHNFQCWSDKLMSCKIFLVITKLFNKKVSGQPDQTWPEFFWLTWSDSKQP